MFLSVCHGYHAQSGLFGMPICLIVCHRCQCVQANIRQIILFRRLIGAVHVTPAEKFLKKSQKRAKVLKTPHRYIRCKQRDATIYTNCCISYYLTIFKYYYQFRLSVAHRYDILNTETERNLRIVKNKSDTIISIV